MRRAALSLLAACLVAACSKGTEENFLKVEEGMTEAQVLSILGRPTESNSVTILGISGTASRWVSGDTVITVRFVNGQVALKTLEKTPK